MNMEFDWYRSTVRADPDQLITSLALLYPDAEMIEHPRGLYNYESRVSVRLGDGDTAGVVCYGGPNGAPMVEASSSYAPALARMLRSEWPHDHRVTRLDVCADMRGDGLFDEMHPRLAALVASHRVKGRMILPDQPIDGRTYNMGSRSSPAYGRFYEKGHERYARTKDRKYLAMLDWVRLEFEFKPVRDNRLLFAHLSPDDCIGYTNWTRAVGSDVLSLDAAKVGISAYRTSHDEIALRYMARQYSRVSERWVANNGGSWAEFGLMFRHLVNDLREV